VAVVAQADFLQRLFVVLIFFFASPFSPAPLLPLHSWWCLNTRRWLQPHDNRRQCQQHMRRWPVAVGGNITGAIEAQEVAWHQQCIGTPLVHVAAAQVNCCFSLSLPHHFFSGFSSSLQQ